MKIISKSKDRKRVQIVHKGRTLYYVFDDNSSDFEELEADRATLRPGHLGSL